AAPRARTEPAPAPTRPAPAAAPSNAPRPDLNRQRTAPAATSHPVAPADGLSPMSTGIVAGATVAIVFVLLLAWGYDRFFRSPARPADGTGTASNETPGTQPADTDHVKNRVANVDQKADGPAKTPDQNPA